MHAQAGRRDWRCKRGTQRWMRACATRAGGWRAPACAAAASEAMNAPRLQQHLLHLLHRRFSQQLRVERVGSGLSQHACRGEKQEHEVPIAARTPKGPAPAAAAAAAAAAIYPGRPPAPFPASTHPPTHPHPHAPPPRKVLATLSPSACRSYPPSSSITSRPPHSSSARAFTRAPRWWKVALRNWRPAGRDARAGAERLHRRRLRPCALLPFAYIAASSTAAQQHRSTAAQQHSSTAAQQHRPPARTCQRVGPVCVVTSRHQDDVWLEAARRRLYHLFPRCQHGVVA